MDTRSHRSAAHRAPFAAAPDPARIQLGRAFSIRAKADRLVTTGIYARIRNPIYLFGALTITSVVFWMGKPWFLLAYLIVAPLQVYRSRQEEWVLTKRFGRTYLDYKQKTWFKTL